MPIESRTSLTTSNTRQYQFWNRSKTRKKCRSNSVPFLLSTDEKIKEEKEWFYKLKISCDMYDMHLIIDRDLQNKYKYLEEYVNQKGIIQPKRGRQRKIEDDSTPLEEIIYSRKNEGIIQQKRGIQRQIEGFDDDTKSTEEIIYSKKQKDHSTLIERPKCSKSCQLVFEKMYQEKHANRLTPSAQILCDHHELFYRFILTRHLRPTQVLYLLKKAMEYQLHKLSKAFGWYLLRRIIKQTKISQFFSLVKDIWPGFFCRCNKKGSSAICSTELVIVIDADEYLEDLPGECFGVPVKQSTFYLKTANTKDKGHSFTENFSNLKEISTISAKNVEELFLRHTKLTLVYIPIDQPWCIKLCCQALGIIPMGEEHLPIDVCSMNTKVLHGNVSFLHKMYVGNKIGPATKTSSGTLGGFVQRRGRDAFLTCSHVIYDRETLLCGNKRDKNKEEVEVKCYFNGDTNTFVCGHVIDDVFEYENFNRSSIDAAVVILDSNTSSIDKDQIVRLTGTGPNPSLQPVTFLGMTSPYINDNYKTHEIKKGVMKARLVGAKSGYFERDVKYEDYDAMKETFKDKRNTPGVIAQWADLEQQFEKVKESNPKPFLVSTDVHLQTTLIPKLDEAVKYDRQFVRFYHQLLMENFPFEKGDSGTCIYIVDDKSHTKESNESNSTGCIGMAIASTKDPRDNVIKTIVTPMEAILEALRLI